MSIIRRDIISGALGAALIAGLAPKPAIAPAADTRAWELTFLKSRAGLQDDLAAFIRANWLAMDAIAVEQGIITDYRLMVDAGDGQEWDVLVAVGYPTADGYAGVAPQFERIRSAHRTVSIGGRTLRELGSIVASRKLLPA